MWFQVYLGFDEDEENVKENTDWWYDEQQSALYKKTLQVPKSVRKTWLLFSHKKINLKILQTKITLFAAREVGITIPMALIQSAVKYGKPWKEFNKNNTEKPIKAIQVETE